jgi:hypothetical protein
MHRVVVKGEHNAVGPEHGDPRRRLGQTAREHGPRGTVSDVSTAELQQLEAGVVGNDEAVVAEPRDERYCGDTLDCVLAEEGASRCESLDRADVADVEATDRRLSGDAERRGDRPVGVAVGYEHGTRACLVEAHDPVALAVGDGDVPGAVDERADRVAGIRLGGERLDEGRAVTGLRERHDRSGQEGCAAHHGEHMTPGTSEHWILRLRLPTRRAAKPEGYLLVLGRGRTRARADSMPSLGRGVARLHQAMPRRAPSLIPRLVISVDDARARGLDLAELRSAVRRECER